MINNFFRVKFLGTKVINGIYINDPLPTNHSSPKLI